MTFIEIDDDLWNPASLFQRTYMMRWHIIRRWWCSEFKGRLEGRSHDKRKFSQMQRMMPSWSEQPIVDVELRQWSQSIGEIVGDPKGDDHIDSIPWSTALGEQWNGSLAGSRHSEKSHPDMSGSKNHFEGWSSSPAYRYSGDFWDDLWDNSDASDTRDRRIMGSFVMVAMGSLRKDRRSREKWAKFNVIVNN